MKAAAIYTHGPPEVLRVIEFPMPMRKPGEVLLRINATSINPVDLKTRAGLFFPWLVPKPKILGGDVAGVVEDVEEAHSPFRRGDRVFGLTDGFEFFKKHGSYAEYMAVKQNWLTAIPDKVSDDQAGAVPLAALTAWQALESAHIQPGQSVLVHGGSGGVGHFAVQIAKLRGAHVVTTCSGAKAKFVKSLGADEVVDYTKERFDELYKDKPFDAIVDTIGGDYVKSNLLTLKRDGFYAYIFTGNLIKKYGKLFGPTMELLYGGLMKFKALVGWGPRFVLVTVKPNGVQMTAIARLLEEGKLRVHVDKIFPLEEASGAHRYAEQASKIGKVVINVHSTTKAPS